MKKSLKITKKIILCVLVCVVVLIAIAIPISATSVNTTPTKYGVYNPFTYVSLEDTVGYQQYWLFNDPRRVNNYRDGDNVLTKENMTVYTSPNSIRENYQADTFMNVTSTYQQWGLRPLFWDYLVNQRSTNINRISVHYDEYLCHNNELEKLTFRYNNANGLSVVLNMSFDVDVTNQTTGERTTYHFTKSKSVNYEGQVVTVGLLDDDAVDNYLKTDYGIELVAGHWLVRNYTLSMRCTEGSFNQFTIYSENLEYYQREYLKEARYSWQYVYDSADSFNFYWLLDAVEGFLAFEILPGFKLYSILIATAGISLFIWFLKMFAGG